MNFSDGFSIDFLMNFERFSEPFGLPKRCENQWKNVTKNSLIFGRLFYEKWSQNSGPGDPNGDQNVGISWTFRNPLPGALQGRVRGGFWMDLGRILGGSWKDFG